MRPARAVWLFLLPVLVFPGAGYAAAVTVQNLRLWRAPDHTRLVFDLSGPLEHRLFSLKNPDRIVLDLDNAVLRGSLPAVETGGPLVRSVRSGRFGTNTLRVVLDLHRAVHPRTFVLKPNDVYGYRLVMDLYGDSAKEAAPARPQPRAPKEIVIAIDAGHGGEDHGAVGRHGTREKDAVLAIARELERMVRAAPGFRAVMTRKGDYYVSLRGRVEEARRQRADLFLSVHADYFPDRSARGSSVYALSQKGASSEAARWLANKENASDLIGGVSLSDKDDLLAKVLLDLSMTQTISDSLDLGGDLLGELGQVGAIHIRNVEQAGFAVLKSPDIPSVLVETAFISNPKEESLLRNKAQQQKIARAIFDGVKRYVARGRVKKTLAERETTPGVLDPPPAATGRYAANDDPRRSLPKANRAR